MPTSGSSVQLCCRQLMCLALLLFIVFPFTELVPLNTYTQPYALLMSLALLPFLSIIVVRGNHKRQFIFLTGFMLLGAVVFILSCYPYDNPREYKNLVSYIGFPSIAICLIYFLKHELELIKKILVFGVYSWLFVGLAQVFFDNSFLSSLAGQSSGFAEDITASGRGAVGLAPEPTHYGFHLLMLGATLALLGGKSVHVFICFAQAILLAHSSSAVMALGLSVGVSYIVSGRLNVKMLIILAGVAVATVFFLHNWRPYSRLYILMGEFYLAPFDILQRDYSVNLRLGGVIASFDYLIQTGLLPGGLSVSSWENASREILKNHDWLVDISKNGMPSGIGVIAYQTGWIGVAFMVGILLVIFQRGALTVNKVAINVVAFIILGQYYISSPIFALVYVAAMKLNLENKEINNEK